MGLNVDQKSEGSILSFTKVAIVSDFFQQSHHSPLVSLITDKRLYGRKTSKLSFDAAVCYLFQTLSSFTVQYSVKV